MVERIERSISSQESLTPVGSVKADIESRFGREIEKPLFKMPGIIRDGLSQPEVIRQTRELIGEIRANYEQDINNLSRENFCVLIPILAERPIPELTQRRVQVRHRLNLIAARIMARIGMDTKHIALELGKDWETVYNWTRDIKEDLQNSKQEMVRELVKKGIPVYKVVGMLHVGYRTATRWCRDILDQFAQIRKDAIRKQKELASEGFWPSYIAQKRGIDRSTALRHVKGSWQGRRAEIEEERRNREERIRASIEEAREKGVKTTISGLARQLRINRKTLAEDLLRLGMSLKN